MANHAWLAIRVRLGLNRSFGRPGIWAGRLVTLVFVMIGWVFFRASDVDAALSMLKAMAGAHGWLALGDPIAQVLAQLRDLGPVNTVAHWLALLSVPFFLALAWLLPNSQQIVDGLGGSVSRFGFRWQPTPAWAACVAACLLYSISQMSQVSAFLYFQF
jgi:hypothetical protein